MKSLLPAATLAAAASLGVTGAAVGQHVRLERCAPDVIAAGKPTELTLGGAGLEGVELWTSFPAEIERLDEKAPRFRLTTSHHGIGAIRAHSAQGASNLVFITIEKGGHSITSSANKTTHQDAQLLEVPAVVDGSSPNLGGHFFRFSAQKGNAVVLHAKALGSDFDGVLTIRSTDGKRRFAQADDSDIDGADPRMVFEPPADGDYVLELADSQYRGGKRYRLNLSGGQGSGEQTGRISGDSGESHLVVFEESGPASIDISNHDGVTGGLEHSDDVDTVWFNLKRRSFVAIVARARALRSPVIPRVSLMTPAGQVIAETPHDLFEERPLRAWLDAGEGYRIKIRDAFGRHGKECRYRLEVDLEAPPFELKIPGQRDKKHPLHDKFLAVPGGVFEVPIECRRHQFDPAVDLCVESAVSFVGENAVIPEKQGNHGLRVRLPASVGPGELINFGVSGSAELGGVTYVDDLKTGEVLAERDQGVAIPPEVDGELAVRVIESPVVVEVSPPQEMERGTKKKIPVKLVWRDEGRKFNTVSRIVGLVPGAQGSEKKLKAGDDTTGLELTLADPAGMELKDLKVQVRLEYHGQALLVESAPFTIALKDRNETKDQ